MAKQGEIEYFGKIGEDGLRHAVHKPFSDGECSKYLFEIGAVFSMLPQPPGRLLDIGCGTGWTSRFFAKRGFEVVGIDIAPKAIEAAREIAAIEKLDNLTFEVCDYEDRRFVNEFDCAVFFDSLHHAVDEQSAVNMTYHALKAGGICATSEPGTGHSTQPGSIEAMKQFNVTEKDMPPKRIKQLGMKAGFKQFQFFPHGFDLNTVFYRVPIDTMPTNIAPKDYATNALKQIQFVLSVAEDSGMVRMIK